MPYSIPIIIEDSISVFFPCYNDSRTIIKLVEDAVGILNRIAPKNEIIVINDGSTDGSYEILESLKNKYPSLRVVHHSKNMGYGAAIKKGFMSCKNDLIFYTDGDGQYDINEITKLLAVIDDADVVNGYIVKRKDPFYRNIFGKIYQILLENMLKINIRYIDCDFRLFKRRVIDDITLDSDGGFICAEMIKKIQEKGFRIKEAPVCHYPRVNGKSKFFKISNIYRLTSDFIKYYFNGLPK